ncbi:MAG: alpha-galactosidase [Anaerolineae bacterium]|nr:alpha-galactosidase [Anaerolineae bacterium]
MNLQLKEWLSGWAPETLVTALADGNGWRIAPAQGTFAWKAAAPARIAGDEATQTWREPGGLEVTLSARRVAGLRVGVRQLTLHNAADHPSQPLAILEPLVLDYPQIAKEDLTVQVLGGGMTYGFYPSFSYKDYTFAAAEADCVPLRFESGDDGRSSNKYLPFVLSMVKEAGVVTALDWSGEWYQTVEPNWLKPGALLRLGLPVRNLVLAPGESLALPVVHLIFFEGDTADGGNACRRYLHERIVPRHFGQAPLPQVAYDHWFGIRADFDEALLRRQVDRATEVGCDYFVVDAAWFKGALPPADFSHGVGNWEHDPAKFPHGLEPFAEYVRSRGMKLGLWFEFERAHRESDSVREHPEWYWDVGAPFLHLDLTRREAQDWIIETLGGLIRRLDLRWVRHDYNFGPRPFWQKADPTGKVMFKYVEGLYRVLDTLLRDHPRLLWETCAGGGRRLDLGILRYSHTSWCCDSTEDPHVARYLICGANRFLPAHVLNSAVTVLNIGAGDSGMSDMNLVSRYGGSLLFSGDIAGWSAAWARRARELVGVYRSLRHLTVQDYYPLTPQPNHPDDPEAVEFVSRAGDEALVLAYRRARRPLPPTLPLRGLVPQADYEVSAPVEGGPTVVMRGAALQTKGLPLSVAPNDAAVRYLKRVR